jgi:hypothetical protein
MVIFLGCYGTNGRNRKRDPAQTTMHPSEQATTKEFE